VIWLLVGLVVLLFVVVVGLVAFLFALADGMWRF
jgi:hypothetical protein